MQARHCPKCGIQLEALAGICPGCGALAPVKSDAEVLAERVPDPIQIPASISMPAAPISTERQTSLVSRLVGFLVVILIVALLLVTFVMLRNSTPSRSKVRNAEAKVNLHDIQLALEKFAAAEGEYPPYLIGGEARYAEAIVAGSHDMPFMGIKECDLANVSDPLLRAGYLTQYPHNPFMKNGKALHTMQCSLPTAQRGEDPLRNDSADGETLGTRFGPECRTLGNVLADPRYPSWSIPSPLGPRGTLTFDSGADVEYDMWDMWVGEQPAPFLPGEFFYKSAGPLVMSGDITGFSGELPLPTAVEYYVLGAYGGIREKGKDMLGEEQQVAIASSSDVSSSDVLDPTLSTLKIWPWTRSQVGSSGRQGSPYSAAKNSGSACYPFAYGNPNGISDAVVLLLTAE